MALLGFAEMLVDGLNDDRLPKLKASWVYI